MRNRNRLVVVAMGFALANGSPLTAQRSEDLSAAATSVADEEAGPKKAREMIEKNSETFRFGLSLGWRHILSDASSLAQDVSIDPHNGNVVAEKLDRGAVVLSGVVTAFPWRNQPLIRGEGMPCASGASVTCHLGSAAALWRLGFIANINVASFSQDNIAVFNKSIEGGLGVAYKMNEDFALAITAERVFGRVLRSFVEREKPLVDADGMTVDELIPSDNRYFRDDNLSAISFKFVYFFK